MKKRNKKMVKDRSLLLRFDKDFEKMLEEIKNLLQFENNNQVIRYAVKQQHRIHVLNKTNINNHFTN